MSTDLTTSIVAMKTQVTRQTAQFAIMKKQHQMQMSLIDMLSQAADSAKQIQSAPPPGQGTRLDTSA